MNSEIIKPLPLEIKRIVQEIEERTATEIGIEPLPVQVRKALGNVPAIKFDGDDRKVTVSLMLPGDIKPPPHMIAHEILHAKHLVLDGAPFLQSKAGPSKLVLTAINNDAAHLEIIPQEIALFPEAKAFWDAEFERGLRSFSNRIVSDSDKKSVRNDLLRLKLVTSKVLPDWQHHEALHAHVRALNLSSDAANLLAGIDGVAGLRDHVLSTLIRFHRLRTDDYLLYYAFSSPTVLPAHRC